MVYSTRLESKEDVARLNKEATKQMVKVLVESGSILVDARSLLALYALIGKEIKLIVSDRMDSKEFLNFIKKVKLWEYLNLPIVPM